MNQSQISQARPSQSDFLSQPFIVLGANPSDTAAQISEAFNTMRARGSESVRELATARDAILEFQTRLPFELDYLLDSSPAQIGQVVNCLRTEAATTKLMAVAKDLPPLSRTHLLTQIAIRQPPDTALLCAFVDAQAAIDVANLYDLLKNSRHIAGAAAPSLANVAVGLQELFQRQAMAVIGSFGNALQASRPLLACLQSIDAGPNVYQLEALTGLISAYQQRAETDIAECERLLGHGAAAFHSAAPAPISIQVVVGALRDWGVLSNPLIAFDDVQCHPETRVSRQAIVMRSLIRDLSNRRRYGDASTVAHTAFEVFSVLPLATNQLHRDIEAFASAALEADLGPIQHMANSLSLHDNLKIFADDLKDAGFGYSSIHSAKTLWDMFGNAVEATRETKSSALPWTLMTNLAIKINEDLDFPRPALAILSGLIRHGEATALAPTLLDPVRDLSNKIRRKLEINEVAAHVEANRNWSALAAIARARKESCHEDVGQLGKLRASLIRRMSLQLASAITLGGSLLCLTSDQLFTTTRIASAAIEDQSPADRAEVIPVPGGERNFSRENLRYCHFQKERLLIIVTMRCRPQACRSVQLTVRPRRALRLPASSSQQALGGVFR